MNIGQTIKGGFYLFILSLPIILINTILFFAAAVGNLGLAFLGAGHLVLVPAAVMVAHLFTGLLPRFFRFREDTVFKPASDLGQLVPSSTYMSPAFNVMPSYWVSHITFFFSYLFFNALDIYKMPPPTEQTPIDEWRVANRKDRSLMIMIMACVLLSLLLTFRIFLTDLDTRSGMLVGVALMGTLGYGWYYAASKAGINRMDLFGIAQQMIPMPDESSTTYCMPTQASR